MTRREVKKVLGALVRAVESHGSRKKKTKKGYRGVSAGREDAGQKAQHIFSLAGSSFGTRVPDIS
jgi:hypothetical protein